MFSYKRRRVTTVSHAPPSLGAATSNSELSRHEPSDTRLPDEYEYDFEPYKDNEQSRTLQEQPKTFQQGTKIRSKEKPRSLNFFVDSCSLRA